MGCVLYEHGEIRSDERPRRTEDGLRGYLDGIQ
jgi:hypothetical protein